MNSIISIFTVLSWLLQKEMLDGEVGGEEGLGQRAIEQRRIVVAIIYLSSPVKFSAWSFIDVFVF